MSLAELELRSGPRESEGVPRFRGLAPDVEVYSIDEAFLDLDCLPGVDL
jgi:nucleotidyltransferase/DNA polymerase involved in DNA repair